MKYKIYEKGKTIEKYKITKNKNKYVIKIYYVNSYFVEIVEKETLEEINNYEKYILDKMNDQIIKFVNNEDIKQEETDRTVKEKIELSRLFMDNLAAILPLVMSYLFKNMANLLLYFPLQVINVITREKLKNNIIEEINEDFLKYYIFSNYIEDFRNYSRYITPQNCVITANNIDNYTLEQIQNYRQELLQLKNEEENIKQKKKVL